MRACVRAWWSPVIAAANDCSRAGGAGAAEEADTIPLDVRRYLAVDIVCEIHEDARQRLIALQQSER